ncbi:hypothetical protein HZS_2146 [Henneguya salminicola]|nr:hypothetical protein HZS_2146 [Henneguya salminicola]
MFSDMWNSIASNICCWKKNCFINKTINLLNVESNMVTSLHNRLIFSSYLIPPTSVWGYAYYFNSAHIPSLRRLFGDRSDAENILKGGEGLIVELDETKLGTFKYHRVYCARVLEGIERNPVSLLPLKVSERTATNNYVHLSNKNDQKFRYLHKLLPVLLEPQYTSKILVIHPPLNTKYHRKASTTRLYGGIYKTEKTAIGAIDRIHTRVKRSRVY